jgi:hypothetical protein
MANEVTGFVARLVALRGDPRRAVFLVFEFVGSALDDGEFDACDELMEQGGPGLIGPEAACAVLAVTLMGAHLLPGRATYLAKVSDWFREFRPDERESMLKGL